MRIGLVLFGHLRSFRSTYNSYKDFLRTLQQIGNVDVFCHSWDIEDSVTPSWWKEHKPGDTPPATVNEEEIREKYKPVRYHIEPSRQFDESNYQAFGLGSVAGILSMLYTQQQAFQLLKDYEEQNNFRYDIVVKTRYDLLYEIAPAFTSLVNDAETNKLVYLPSSNPYELIGSCSDIFAVGDRTEMVKYFSFCDNFKKALEIYKSKNYGQLVPEFCMTVYLDSIGINRKELTGLRLHILRNNGFHFQINSEKYFEGNEPLCFYSETIKTAKKMLIEKKVAIKKRSHDLAKKYTSWIDKDGSEDLYESYAGFYAGNWIGASMIKRLARKGKMNKIFKNSVMKNFFEEAMRNAGYSDTKKILLASILMLYSGYGLFFFKVWRSIKQRVTPVHK